MSSKRGYTPNVLINRVTVVFGDETIQFKPVSTDVVKFAKFLHTKHVGCRFGYHPDIKYLLNTSVCNKVKGDEATIDSLSDFREELLEYISNSRSDITEDMKDLLSVFFTLRMYLISGYEKDSILTLNRPERGLHPRKQQKLMKVILSVCESLDMPVLIVTDSPFILRSVEVYRSNRERTVGFQLMKVSCNKSHELSYEDCTAYPESVWRDFAYVFQDCENDFYRD